MDIATLAVAQEAAQRLTCAEQQRRRAEAGKVEALCDLAEVYNLDDEELFLDVLLDQQIQAGSPGTPLVSEMVSLEIATLLGIPVIQAAGQLSAALDLKYRHPRLYEAVVNVEIEVDRALMMTSRCRDLHPILLDEVTDAWLRQQGNLTWTQARRLVDKLVIQADPELAAKKERSAREQRGVWVWGLNDGVMNLTGALDVLDARFLDARLTEMAGLIEPQFPGLTTAQRRAKAVGVLANPAYALALLQEAAQPMLIDDDTAALLNNIFRNRPSADFVDGSASPNLARASGGAGSSSGHHDAVVVDPVAGWAADSSGGQWQLTARDLGPRWPDQPPPEHHAGRAGQARPGMIHADGTLCGGLRECRHGQEPPRAHTARENSARDRGEDSAHGHGLASGDGVGSDVSCGRGPGADDRWGCGHGCSCPDTVRARRFDPHECAGHHCGTITTPLAKLRPSLGIAVHISSDTLGGLDPAARVEKAGTITTALLAELLREGNKCDLKVYPVIDLPNLAPADGYVPSQTMRKAMIMAFPNEPFPFSQRDSARLDMDHTIPFQPGKSGQTRVGNLAPLTRKVHRAKTAGFWVMNQPAPGRIEWRSPLGYCYDVTPFGTERCPVIRIDYDQPDEPAA